MKERYYGRRDIFWDLITIEAQHLSCLSDCLSCHNCWWTRSCLPLDYDVFKRKGVKKDAEDEEIEWGLGGSWVQALWCVTLPGKGHGNPLHYSCLENPMGRGAWQATVLGVAKSRTWLRLGLSKYLPGTWLSTHLGCVKNPPKFPWTWYFGILWRPPWWLRWYSVCLQCGRPEFDPWVRKIPWRRNDNLLQCSCLENPMDRGA